MRKLSFIMVILLCFACAPAKKLIVTSTIKEQSDTANDIQKSDSTHVFKERLNGVKIDLKDHYNMQVLEITYDSSKVVIPGTNHPPILKTRKVVLTRVKESLQLDTTRMRTEVHKTSAVNDQSRLISKVNENSIIDSQQNNKLKGYQVFLMWCGAIVLLGLGVYFGFKYVKTWL